MRRAWISIQLIWQAGAGTCDYDLQISADGEDWQTVHIVRDGDGSPEIIRKPLRPIRGVKQPPARKRGRVWDCAVPGCGGTQYGVIQAGRAARWCLDFPLRVLTTRIFLPIRASRVRRKSDRQIVRRSGRGFFRYDDSFPF